jgi:hypothetical protein
MYKIFVENHNKPEPVQEPKPLNYELRAGPYHSTSNSNNIYFQPDKYNFIAF